MARYTVFDGIDLLFLDVKRETIQFSPNLILRPLQLIIVKRDVLNVNSHLENTCIWGPGICR